MTNEKITEILDRCNGSFGWVQIHIDTEENYMLMPLADLVELLEKQLPKMPIKSDREIRYCDLWKCPSCGFEWSARVVDFCYKCGQRLDWEEIE